MPRKPLALLAALFLTAALDCSGENILETVDNGQTSDPPIAFVNVNVIPMTSDQVIYGQTVLIENGLIKAIGTAGEVSIPAGVRVIDGSGQYLIPGLADMHVHLRHIEELPVYFTGGVTTLLDMGAPEVLLEWRDQLEAGALPGPRLLVSYFIDGPEGQFSVEQTVESARAAVRRAGEKGYDYIKVYNALTTAQLEAILEEAQDLGIAVIGHGVREPGLEWGMEHGQRLVAHSEEFVYSMFGFRDNRSLIPAAVEVTERTNTYVIPNLSAFEIMDRQWGKPAAIEEFFAMDEVQYLHEEYDTRWRSGRYTARNGSISARLQFLKELTRALQDGGVMLLAGTDSPTIPGMFAGASIHNDLQLMVDAGLTPYESLLTATRNPGLFVQETRPGTRLFGVIQAGAAADLVLLAENPLDDITRAEHPVGVMRGGQWWPADELATYLRGLYPYR